MIADVTTVLGRHARQTRSPRFSSCWVRWEAGLHLIDSENPADFANTAIYLLLMAGKSVQLGSEVSDLISAQCHSVIRGSRVPSEDKGLPFGFYVNLTLSCRGPCSFSSCFWNDRQKARVGPLLPTRDHCV